jgi:oligopeptide transport system permease protein
VGLCAAVVAASVGGLYGAMAGYVGGLGGEVMMRAVDVLYTLPFMFVVIVLLTLLGNSLTLLFVGLGLVSWLSTARAVRAHVLTLMSQDFVPALKLLGASSARIVLGHLIPNVMGTVVVMFTLSVPTLVLEEAFLSFLGLGVQAPDASLGSLVADGIETVSIFWWPLVFPAATLSVLLLALNLLGDGLRQRLDPRAVRAR